MRLMLLLCHVTNTLLLHRILRANHSEDVARAGALLFALFAVSPAFEGTAVTPEPFLTVFTLAGLTLAAGKKTSGSILSGAAFGCAFVIKQNALILVALLIFRLPFRRLILAAAGFLAVQAICVAAFAHAGALQQLLACTVSFPLKHRNAGFHANEAALDAVRLVLRLVHANPSMTAFALVLIPAHALLSRKGARLLAAWLGLSSIATLTQGRNYPHYVLLLVAPLAALAACGYGELRRRRGRTARVVLVILLLGVAADVVRVGGHMLRQRNEAPRFKPVASALAAGQWIRERTTAADPVFVWGPDLFLYTAADRLAPTRMVLLYPVVGANRGWRGNFGTPGAGEELRNDLALHPPAYIVHERVLPLYDLDQPHLSWLATILERYYVLETVFDPYALYRRRGMLDPK
jgi:hypothetical protein